MENKDTYNLFFNIYETYFPNHLYLKKEVVATVFSILELIVYKMDKYIYIDFLSLFYYR